MSSLILWLGGAVYLFAVIRTTGKRYDAEFISWQERMKRATYAGTIYQQTGKGTYHVN